MTEDIADPSPPKRKKGRQKTVQTTAPLVELEGNTKEEKLLALYNQWFGCTKCPLGKFREEEGRGKDCLLYTSPSPRDGLLSRMPSSA